MRRVASPADLPEHDPALMRHDAVIAIDGPAGSGKSTTARALAERFGLLYIDTGAMYRALTLAAFGAGVARDDEQRWRRCWRTPTWSCAPAGARSGAVERAGRVPGHPHPGGGRGRLGGQRPRRRAPATWCERQQAFGRRGGVVMEGRDIGSVVFPLATAKIFLEASLEARVERRVRQYRQRGREVTRADVAHDLAARDRLDSERANSPLAIAPDAMVVDSSDLSLDQQNEACARAGLVNPALDRLLDADPVAARLEQPALPPGLCRVRALARFYGLRQYGNAGPGRAPGLVVACNHVSYWDPPLVGATLQRYPVHTLAKEELFKPSWPNGAIFRWLDTIPIRRRGYDHAAFAVACARWRRATTCDLPGGHAAGHRRPRPGEERPGHPGPGHPGAPAAGLHPGQLRPAARRLDPLAPGGALRPGDPLARPGRAAGEPRPQDRQPPHRRASARPPGASSRPVPTPRTRAPPTRRPSAGTRSGGSPPVTSASSAAGRPQTALSLPRGLFQAAFLAIPGPAGYNSQPAGPWGLAVFICH